MSTESSIISNSIVEETQYENKDFCIERSFIDYNFIIDNYSRRRKIQLNKCKNFEEISIVAADKKMILLSDYAGTGKTTTFKHLKMKLKQKYPMHWISYIDIKDHLNDCEEIFQVLPVLLQILNITDEIDVELFTNFFYADKVILLFDDFSGIPHKSKEFFIKLFQDIQKSTQNQQWIAFQPQDVDILMKNLNQSAYKFIPFDDSKKVKIIRNIMRNFNIKDNAEKVFKDIQVLCYDDLLSNPLMLQIMVIFYLSNKDKSFNSCSFLDKMIQDKLKDAGNEKSKMSIWQVHQVYALQICFKDGLIDHLTKHKSDDDDYESEPDADQHESDIDTNSEHTSDAESTRSCDYASLIIDTQNFQLLQKWKEEKSNWTAEEISKYGLLYIDYFNTPEEFAAFKHSNLTDFFVTQYAIDKIFDADDSDEPKLSIELLLSLTNDYNRGNIISTLIENQTPKKLSDKMYKFAVSNQMHQVIKNEKILKKLFCCDERFLKVFRFAGNMTIFQKDFRSNYYYSNGILRIYEKTLGAEWIRYTGYKLKDNNNYTVPTDDEIDKIFANDFVKETIDEKDQNSENVKIECKNFYKLFCFVDRVKFPRKDFLRIFENRACDIFDYSFRSRAMIEKLIEIIRNNIEKCKDEFHKLFEYNIFGNDFYVKIKVPATDEYVRNIAYFCDQFVKYSLNDSTLKHFQLRIIARFCSFETLTNLHDKYQICTQNEIQELFISYSVPIIHIVTSYHLNNSVSKNLEIITKNIFNDQGKSQLRKFIKKRYKSKDGNSDYDGHTILSFVRKEYDSEKYNKFYIHGLKIAQNVIIKIARMLEICDDEIEMLQEFTEG